MSKLTVTLFLLLMISAGGLVTSQHQARKLYAELEREKQLTKQIETEFTQLQIEQSTWSMHSRIEKVATSRLHMGSPAAEQLHPLDTPVAPAYGVPEP